MILRLNSDSLIQHRSGVLQKIQTAFAGARPDSGTPLWNNRYAGESVRLSNSIQDYSRVVGTLLHLIKDDVNEKVDPGFFVDSASGI